MCGEICSKKTHDYKHRHNHNSIRTLQRTRQEHNLFLTPLWTHSTVLSWCELRWVLVTYPRKWLQFSEITTKVSLPSVLLDGTVSAQPVSGRPYELQRQRDTVGVITYTSHQLGFVYRVCEPRRVGEALQYAIYRFTIPDVRCVFKKATQLLSIFRVTVTICQLNYQGV